MKKASALPRRRGEGARKDEAKRGSLPPDIKDIHVAGKGDEVEEALDLIGSPIPFSKMSDLFDQMDALLREKGLPSRREMLRDNANKMIADRDWLGYVLCHPRPLRLRCLFNVMDRVTDSEYWELLRAYWPDTELPSPNKKYWLWLFTSPRSDRDSLMNDEERAALAALPDPCVLYRGLEDPKRGARGLSWTPDLNTAAWFAFRGSTPTVLRAQVPKKRVLVYFLEREIEVVIDPTRYQI